MGTYYLIVNSNKRQYLRPGAMLWADKIGGLVDGPPARALALLVCRAGASERELLGAWHGDRVFAAAEDELIDDPALAFLEGKSLYQAALDSFEDLSLRA